MAPTLKGMAARMAENLQVFRKDVFALDGVPAFRRFYDFYIFPWKYVYQGFYAAWHDVPVNTIKDHSGNKKRRMATMNAAQMVCRTMARYIWGERCKIRVTREGATAEEAGSLQEFIDHVLRENGFNLAFGEDIEKAMALGGAAIKEWAYIPKDREGNDAGPARIMLSYHSAEQFIPTAWNNHKVKEAIFISREAKDGFYYSRVEWHKWQGETYVVTNELYRQKMTETKEPQTVLGWYYPLNLVYPLLSPSTEMRGLVRSVFQYIRPFGANTFDDNSPLGMSVFSGAMDTLRALDICFDSFQREFVLGKKRIIVPTRAIRWVVSPDGQRYRYFDSSDEVYQTIETDDAEALKIHDNSVELRVEEHVSAINALLAILAAQVGFDPGILSFSLQQGLKTATEVISQNSKTYDTVKNHQNNLRDVLRDMVDAIIELAVQYGVEWGGRPVADLVSGGYNVAITFDDSIIQDRAADIAEGIQKVNANVMSRFRFLTEIDGMTPEEAEKEIARIKKEQASVAVENIDDMFSGMA